LEFHTGFDWQEIRKSSSTSTMSGVYFVTISWLPAKCHRVKLLLLHFCIVETNNLTLKFLYPNLVCAVKRKRMLMMGLGGVAAAAGKRQRG
jgi:hypothetical protein